jgi:hypothetical protein
LALEQLNVHFSIYICKMCSECKQHKLSLAAPQRVKTSHLVSLRALREATLDDQSRPHALCAAAAFGGNYNTYVVNKSRQGQVNCVFELGQEVVSSHAYVPRS